jgi:antitoxin HicB
VTTTTNTQPAEYFLGLRYPVMLRALAPEEGGGYVAAIPQLGIRTFVAVGETPTEALEALDELRRMLIPEMLAAGVKLPEPRDERDAVEQFSGNLVLRIPRGLHAQLAAAAKKNGCSINKLATQLLAQNLERAEWLERTRELVEEVRSATQHPPHSPEWLRVEIPTDTPHEIAPPKG